MDKIKYGCMWGLDGSFYTEDLIRIKETLKSLYIEGKRDYTIIDHNGEMIALIQVYIDLN